MNQNWTPRAQRWTTEEREQLKIRAQNSRKFARNLYKEKMDFYRLLKEEIAQKMFDSSVPNE